MCLNTGRASNTGRGSDIIVLIEAGGFYSRKYGIPKSECSKYFCNWGSASDPAEGVYKFYIPVNVSFIV